MSNLNLKGIWIPVEILLNEKLSDKEKMILSMILYLSEETGNCFASNKYIANILNVTAGRVSKIVNALKNKGYIEIELKFKLNSKEIENRQLIPNREHINRCSQKYLEDMVINNYSSSQNRPLPMVENDKDIINIIKNKNSYSNIYYCSYLI